VRVQCARSPSPYPVPAAGGGKEGQAGEAWGEVIQFLSLFLPLPVVGEGWGEGAVCSFALPLTPSQPREGGKKAARERHGVR